MSKALLYRPAHGGHPSGSRPTRHEKIRSLAQEIAQEHGFTIEDILRHARPAELVRARQTAYRAALAAGYRPSEIARALNRTHGTILHARKKA